MRPAFFVGVGVGVEVAAFSGASSAAGLAAGLRPRIRWKKPGLRGGGVGSATVAGLAFRLACGLVVAVGWAVVAVGFAGAAGSGVVATGAKRALGVSVVVAACGRAVAVSSGQRKNRPRTGGGICFMTGMDVCNVPVAVLTSKTRAMKAVKLPPPPLFGNPGHLPLVVGVLFLAVFPFFLNRRFRVARRRIVRAGPAAIFPFLNELRNWPLWMPWGGARGLEYRYEGPVAGVGAVQHWRGGGGAGTARILQSMADERVVYQVEMERGIPLVEGVLALEALGEVTRVVWYCRWDPNACPCRRYVDLFFKWRLDHDFGVGLDRLGRLVEAGDGAVGR